MATMSELRDAEQERDLFRDLLYRTWMLPNFDPRVRNIEREVWDALGVTGKENERPRDILAIANDTSYAAEDRIEMIRAALEGTTAHEPEAGRKFSIGQQVCWRGWPLNPVTIDSYAYIIKTNHGARAAFEESELEETQPSSQITKESEHG
jgi:hypothetical protein